MKDSKTLAYINLFGIFGSIPKLCEVSDEAKQLIEGQNVSLGFVVKGGPSGTLIFEGGKCRMVEGVDKCDIKLPFSSPEKFNGMIDGTTTPIPSKGFTKLSFLLKRFIPLTDLLSKYLRASEDDLKVEDFHRASTKIMFCVITSAISQIANHDKIGSFSASNMVDGIAKLAIADSDEAYITCRDHKLSTSFEHRDDFTAYMVFESIKTARELFDGKINAVSAVGLGKIRIGGMIANVDNLNRILDRVSFYLA